MKILLLGSQGQLGRELTRVLAPGPGVSYELIVLNRQQLDLYRLDTLEIQLAPYLADVIINATGYTAVDQAELEQDQAMAINARAVAVLAQVARAKGALLVHYSTDYVFDGKQETPYCETDLPHPLNVYGRSKLAGEYALQASGCDYLLLRTSWVYSGSGNNFVPRILALARERSELRVVDDQQGSPTAAHHLAQASARLIELAHTARQQQSFASALYHLCGTGHTNWYEFACAVVVEAQTYGLLRQTCLISPVASENYPQAAKRPRNSRLSGAKLKQQGIQLPPWRDGLREVIKTLSDSPT